MHEIDGVLSEIKQDLRGSFRAIYRSSKFSVSLLKKLIKLRNEGKVSNQALTEYEEFLDRNKGRVRNASIPVREDRAEQIKLLFDKELELENATDRREQARLKAELTAIKESIPELRELKQREIDFYLFPKITGDTNRIQVAVAEKDLPKFYEWLQEHLETNLSSGELSMSEFSVFTDNQYQFYKVPYEGEALTQLVEEMRSFKLNPYMMTDLKEGDFEGWLAIPDSDSGRTLSYLKAKGIRYQKGSKEEYFQSAERSEDEVLKEMLGGEAASEYAEELESRDYVAGFETEASHNYAMFITNENCERITVPEEYIKEGFAYDAMQEAYGPEGYFAARLPRSYGDESEILLFDRCRVFKTEDEKSFDIFVYKNEGIPSVKPGENAENPVFNYHAALEVKERFKEAYDAGEKVSELAKEAAEKAAEAAKDTVKDSAKEIMQELTERIGL